MKTTDYSQISDRYDQNQYRIAEVDVDDDLKQYIDQKNKNEYDVLDLACGTGIYLEEQMKYFNKTNINWFGLDASNDMLEIANNKLENVSLTQANAEQMPYSSSTFDFIANNYALHHFKNKDQVLTEIYRILKNGGIYKLHNISIHDMPKWWIYYYFPSTYDEDLKRYWSKEIIFNELSNLGFKVQLKIGYRMEKVKVADYLDHAENRDISVLTLINDEDYKQGLERLKYDVKKDPQNTITNDFAEMFCIAVK